MVLVLLTSSALAAAYAHLHCGMVAAPQDYLVLAEAKLAAVLLCSFFFLGRHLAQSQPCGSFSHQIRLHLFQPHQADQMFDLQGLGPSYASSH